MSSWFDFFILFAMMFLPLSIMYSCNWRPSFFDPDLFVFSSPVLRGLRCLLLSSTSYNFLESFYCCFSLFLFVTFTFFSFCFLWINSRFLFSICRHFCEAFFDSIFTLFLNLDSRKQNFSSFCQSELVCYSIFFICNVCRFVQRDLFPLKDLLFAFVFPFKYILKFSKLY